jgi:hypothetical protein
MTNSSKTAQTPPSKEDKLTTYNDFVRRFYPSDEKATPKANEKVVSVETTLGAFYAR